jgi:hypothetical protein
VNTTEQEVADTVEAVCEALEAQGGARLDEQARQAIRDGLTTAPPLSPGQLLAVSRLLRGSRHWPGRAA